MRRTAIFTGAGASRAFGYPLTGELFPNIRDDLARGKAFEGIPPTSKNAELDSYLVRLLPGYRDQPQLPLITDVLSLVDYSLLVSSTPIPGVGLEELRRFRALLEEAIFHALWWPYDPNDPPERLRRLAEWCVQQGKKANREIALISTNYDIAIDDLLLDAYGAKYGPVARAFDFGFAWRDPGGTFRYRPAQPSLRVYKLHGSLNWLRCELCEHIYVNVEGSIAWQAFRTKVDDNNSCYCGHQRLRAVLVAPSLVRDVRDVNLLETWKATLEYLRLADEWVIAGYSFPPEDIAIRSLLVRAYGGRPDGERPAIRVVQPAPDASLEARFKVFFPDCQFEYGGLEAFIDGLKT